MELAQSPPMDTGATFIGKKRPERETNNIFVMRLRLHGVLPPFSEFWIVNSYM
jgi:hypothetical protein